MAHFTGSTNARPVQQVGGICFAPVCNIEITIEEPLRTAAEFARTRITHRRGVVVRWANCVACPAVVQIGLQRMARVVTTRVVWIGTRLSVRTPLGTGARRANFAWGAVFIDYTLRTAVGGFFAVRGIPCTIAIVGTPRRTMKNRSLAKLPGWASVI